MSGNKVTLNNEDWLALFPETNFTIGTTTLRLMPLTVTSVARVLKQLSYISNLLVEEGLTLKDLSKDNVSAIIKLVSVIVEQAPGILSEMSGLDEFDVQRLPLNVAVDLFTACLDLNLASQEGLVKNFNRLGEKIVALAGMNQRL